MKVTIKTLQNRFDTTIEIPGSKSITNRALLIAALAEGQSLLKGMLMSDDTMVCGNALRQLGVELDWDLKKNYCIVQGCNGHFSASRANVWCQDAGTATRFLLAATAQTRGQYDFDASKRMRERPLHQLIEVLQKQGAKFLPQNTSNMPFHLIGQHGLQGGDIFISSKLTSQFISALLMVAPYAKKTVTLITDTTIARPYIDMTCEMMKSFGVTVTTTENDSYRVTVPQSYSAREYTIEPDLSTSSYFFAAAALTQSKITIPNIKRHESLQGDVEFLTILEKMGCEISEHEFGISLKGPEKLSGIEVDMSQCSDTFMTLAALAPFAEDPIHIYNIKHARLQESDRIAAVAENMQKLGIKTEVTEDSIKIFPGKIKPGIVNSFKDHRIAMSFALIGFKIPGIEIEDAECVAKTCPHYFNMLNSLHPHFASNLPRT